ncbi:hypothetical protein GCM10010279_29230 [Streptomyces mutabilis]|nr:hypothetical protein GCM10010279_29230 [Streptomyces mutabilis]
MEVGAAAAGVPGEARIAAAQAASVVHRQVEEISKLLVLVGRSMRPTMLQSIMVAGWPGATKMFPGCGSAWKTRSTKWPQYMKASRSCPIALRSSAPNRS